MPSVVHKHISSKLFCFAICAMVLFLSHQPSYAGQSQQPVSFTLLNDGRANISINDVCCGKDAGLFREVETGVIHAPPGKPVIWLNFPPFNREGILDFGILAEDITLYSTDEAGKFISIQNGKMLDKDIRLSLDPSIHFPISEEVSRSPLYVRINQMTAAPISPQFLANADFVTKRAKSMNIHGLLIGAAIIMMAFNLSLGIINRDILFVLNMATVAGAFVANLAFTGIGPSYIWPENAGATLSIFTLAMIGSTAAACLFLYKFLAEPRETNRWIRSVVYLPLLLLAPLGAWLIGNLNLSHGLFSLFNGIITLYALFVLMLLVSRAHPRAMMLLPTLLLALVPTNVMFIASLYFDQDTPVPSEHLFEFMMVSEALLFSLILAYRIRHSNALAAQASQQLRRMEKSARENILNSIDNERKRIASDLHDSAGQGLMEVANRLSGIIRKQKLSEAGRSEIRRAADYSRSVVGDIRRISHDLHPAIIDHLGWKNALDELFGTLVETGGFEILLDLDVEESDLNDGQKLHVYRIVQELISNISKHAKADKVSARFWVEDILVKGEIIDNGLRSITKVGPGPSMGHEIINQRVEFLGGTWSHERVKEENVVALSFPFVSEAGQEGSME